MDKMHKYLPTPLILLSFLLSFVAIYSTGSPILKDPDMGWHIAAGDLIRNAGAIPMQDSWSFSGTGQIWYNLSWLWDVIISLVHEYVGIQGLFVFAVSCPALLVALLLSSLNKRGDIGVNALIFTGMITAYCMLEFSTGRPQIAAMFLALAFSYLLYYSRDNITGKKLFLLPVLMVVWANVHGSYLAGFIAIGAYGLEAIYTKNRQWFSRLFMVGCLCVPALFVNPYGFDILTGVLRTLDSVITQYIFEWKPFVFGENLGVSIWFLTMLVFGNLRNEKIPLADRILAIMWLVAMLFSVRNVGFLAIFAAPYIAFNLPADNLKDSNTRKISAWINDKKFSPYLLAFIPVALVASYLLLPKLGSSHYIETTEASPMPAINFVMKNYPGKRVLNDWDYGGRIIYESKGTFPVFIDGRAGTNYDEKILGDYISFIEMKDDWQAVYKPYNIDIILVGNKRNFVKNYEKGKYRDSWKQVYSDEVASVYVNKTRVVPETQGMDNKTSQYEAARKRRAMGLLRGLLRTGRLPY